MTIEFLDTYFGLKGLDGYNAVHYYSQIQKQRTKKYTKENCIEIWNKSRTEIEEKLIDRFKRLGITQKFYLVVPPTNSERKAIFLNPLIEIIKKHYPNAILIDACIRKKNESISAATLAHSQKEVLRKNLIINKDCLHLHKLPETIPLIIMDDVISSGATLNVIAESLASLSTDCYGFAILKTESVSNNLKHLIDENASAKKQNQLPKR